jgi:hypothetical protein
LFSLLSESKPKVSQQQKVYNMETGYNENYNYAYQSLDSADELMMIGEKYDGDNNLMNVRLGAQLGAYHPPQDNSSTLNNDVDYE